MKSLINTFFRKDLYQTSWALSETIYTFKNVLHIDFLYLPTRKSFPTQYLLREQERRQKIVESWEDESSELKHKYFVCLKILYFSIAARLVFTRDYYV